jgi:polyhydroxyalkanoate synthesis regulator phasin
MAENNKMWVLLSIGILIILGYHFNQIEKKLDLIWEDITIVGDTLKSDLDEIKEKLDALESEIQDIRK